MNPSVMLTQSTFFEKYHILIAILLRTDDFLHSYSLVNRSRKFPGNPPLMHPPSWIQDLPVASPSLPFPSLLLTPLSLIINSNIPKVRATGDEAVSMVDPRQHDLSAVMAIVAFFD